MAKPSYAPTYTVALYASAFKLQIYAFAHIDILYAIAYLKGKGAHMTEDIARTEKQLGAILRRHRRTANLTQSEVGERKSLRQATISKLEDGAPATQLQTVMAVLAALDLELVIRPRTKGTGKGLEDIF